MKKHIITAFALLGVFLYTELTAQDWDLADSGNDDVTSKGKVGIMQYDPSYELDVAGSINFTGSILSSGTVVDIGLLDQLSATDTANFGGLFINKSAQSGVRETLLRAVVSDDGNSAAMILNGTIVNGNFAPTFAGFNQDQASGVSVTGLVADDSGSNAITQFLSFVTDNASDPMNGNLSAPINRPLFKWGTVSGISFMQMEADGDLRLLSETDSTNPTTGAMTIAGGLGVGKAVWLGNKLEVANNIYARGDLYLTDDILSHHQGWLDISKIHNSDAGVRLIHEANDDASSQFSVTRRVTQNPGDVFFDFSVSNTTNGDTLARFSNEGFRMDNADVEAVVVAPTYVKDGGNYDATDLLIDSTVTQWSGGGNHRLFDAKVNGGSQFFVESTGHSYAQGSLGTGGMLYLEGATTDDFEAQITTVDPTGSDNVHTLPDKSGTIAHLSDIPNLDPSGSVVLSQQIISSSQASTDSQTGALVVNGGVGVAGDINLAGKMAAAELDVVGDAFVTGNLEVAGAFVLDGENVETSNIAAVSKFTPVYVRGSGNNSPLSRKVVVGEQSDTSASRGLRLVVVAATSHQILSSETFDTYGSTQRADDLAAAIRTVDRSQIGILTSHDAFTTQMTTNLRESAAERGLYRLAAARTVGDHSDARLPYAAIFQGGGTLTGDGSPTAKAVEVMNDSGSNDGDAVIVSAFYENGFIGQNLSNVLVSGDPADSTPGVFVDFYNRVGINTMSPSQELDVAGEIKFGASAETTWGYGLLTSESGWNGKSYPSLGSVGGTSGSLAMIHNPHIPFRTDNKRAAFGGKAGIRMAADAAATANWDAGLGGDFYYIDRRADGVDTEFFRITNTGKVGIGTAAPSAPLHVSKLNSSYTQLESVIKGAVSGGGGEPAFAVAVTGDAMRTRFGSNFSYSADGLSQENPARSSGFWNILNLTTPGKTSQLAYLGLTPGSVSPQTLFQITQDGDAVFAGDVSVDTLSFNGTPFDPADFVLVNNTDSISGGTTGLTLAAGGVDQDVVLSPSGLGRAVVQGRLAIGDETEPEGYLYVYEPDPNEGLSTLFLDAAPNMNANIMFGVDGDRLANIRVDEAGADQLQFMTGPSLATAMSIDVGGQVGIGTELPVGALHIFESSPTATLHLDAAPNNNANIQFSVDGSRLANLRVNESGDDQFEITMGSETDPALVVDQSSRVGIGTSSPNAKLTIGYDGTIGPASTANFENSAAVLTDGAYLMALDNNQIVSTHQSVSISSAHPSGRIFLTTGGTDQQRLTVRENGDVGIGQANPTSRLHVQGTGRFTSDLTADSSLAIGQGLSVGADANVTGALSSATLTTGAAALGSVSITTGLSVGTNADVIGDLTSGTLSTPAAFVGDASISNNLVVAQSSTLNSLTATSADIANGSADAILGADTLIVRGGAQADSLAVTTDTATATLTASGQVDAGSLLVEGDADVSGELSVQNNTSILGNLVVAGTTSSNANGGSDPALTLGSATSADGGTLRMISANDNWWGFSTENNGFSIFKESSGGSNRSSVLTFSASGTPTSGTDATTKTYVDDHDPFVWSGLDIYPKNLADRLGLGLSNPSEYLSVLDRAEIRGSSGSDSSIYFRLPDYQGTTHNMVIGVDRSDGGKFKIDDGQNLGTTSLFTVEPGGDVGIGTSSPDSRLDVISSGSGSLARLLTDDTSGNVSVQVGRTVGTFMNLGVGSAMGTTPMPYIWSQSGDFMIGADGNPGFVVRGMAGHLANVGIGTANPTHKLTVEGTIRARELLIDDDTWADYVFADDYDLKPLEEVEEFIEENSHLPDVPSAAQVAENGVNVGEMQVLLLRKVEELTLHVIEQGKRINALEAENAQLRSR